MTESIVIEPQQHRLEAINRFCYLVAAVAAASAAMLFARSHWLHALVLLAVAGTLAACARLNNKEKFSLSRIGILLSTNLGIFYFSALLGAGGGMHLYLFTVPLICVLLYDIHAWQKISLAFAVYVITFLVALAAQRFSPADPLAHAAGTRTLVYAFNFAFSLLLCFTLLMYFGGHYAAHVRRLEEANRLLVQKHEQLQQEISGRAYAQHTVSEAIKDRDKLLQEVHHRVKNNLAVISGLVELQNFYTRDEKASAILQQSRSRIKSIAVLHEKLYESKSLERIDMKSYVDELLYFIRLTFTNQQKDIIIDTDIPALELGMAEALPFSLLLNELLTNSYKHAFRELDAGRINLSLRRNGEREVVFRYKDNGCGFDYVNFSKDQSLGLNLVDTSCRQLKGRMNFVSAPGNGVDFTLQFEA